MKNMLGVYIGTEEFLILAPRVQLEVSFVEDISDKSMENVNLDHIFSFHQDSLNFE